MTHQTRKRKRNQYNKTSSRGGKVIASGGFGCVFSPALKCQGSDHRNSKQISKLMVDRHAEKEYEEIQTIKSNLQSIPHFEDYFLLQDTSLCRPAKLSRSDLSRFKRKCSALPKNNITKRNINQKLDKVMMINMPNGGEPLDDFLLSNGSFGKMLTAHKQLTKLLTEGIMPMNKRHVFHSDIKESNILVDNDGHTRLIDWGLSVQYKPNQSKPFPHNWRNRPLQFNLPFTVILFTDAFVDKYKTYLKEGGKTTEEALQPFVFDYVKEWINVRGPGHYRFINEIVFRVFEDELSHVSPGDRPSFVESQLTVPLIVDNLVDVLVHFTKVKSNGEVNLRQYVNKVFVHIIDVYGFLTAYIPLLEVLSNHASTLDDAANKLFGKVKFMFKHYVLTPRHQPYNMSELIEDLEDMEVLIRSNVLSKEGDLAKSSTTNKTKSVVSFERQPLVKRFKNAILLKNEKSK